MKRRFVFVLACASNSMIDGSDLEVRAETVSTACREAGSLARQFGAQRFRLIGERKYSGSDARFISFVSDSELPEHIKQNERVYSKVREVA